MMFFTFKFKKIMAAIIILIFAASVVAVGFYRDYARSRTLREVNTEGLDKSQNEEFSEGEEEPENTRPPENTKPSENPEAAEKKYIKWVDFSIPDKVLDKTLNLDIKSQSSEVKLNWIELLSYLSARYGGNYNSYKQKDLDNLVARLNKGEKIEDITKDMKYYPYYHEAYDAILNQFVGSYKIETVDKTTGEKVWQEKYGLKAFLPVAKGYGFSHYDDFGSGRSFGYKRKHLGNDLMGSVGTPIVAVESGTIEVLGWNMYGGWRVGIRSFDKKRYYYYAHLKKDGPYHKELEEGQVIKAGDVIGYLGMTGYSRKENVNNINVPHLHFGMQIIFDEVQKDGINQIWIDVYNIIELLKKNRSAVYKDTEKKDFYRVNEIFDPSIPE